MAKLEKLNNKKPKNKKYRIIGKQSLSDRSIMTKIYDEKQINDIYPLNNHDKIRTNIQNIPKPHNLSKTTETSLQASDPTPTTKLTGETETDEVGD